MGAPGPNQRKKVTLNSLRSLYKKGEPITMITAHDFPSGHVGDAAGMEMILVGDSLAMVALGMEDTSEVLLEEMLLHCRSVSRAAKAAFTVSAHPRLFRAKTKYSFHSGRRSTHGFIRNRPRTSLGIRH
jgi:3-methyl-2-oxobutanoate hydroxymethyltransferase